MSRITYIVKDKGAGLLSGVTVSNLLRIEDTYNPFSVVENNSLTGLESALTSVGFTISRNNNAIISFTTEEVVLYNSGRKVSSSAFNTVNTSSSQYVGALFLLAYIDSSGGILVQPLDNMDTLLLAKNITWLAITPADSATDVGLDYLDLRLDRLASYDYGIKSELSLFTDPYWVERPIFNRIQTEGSGISLEEGTFYLDRGDGGSVSNNPRVNFWVDLSAINLSPALPPATIGYNRSILPIFFFRADNGKLARHNAVTPNGSGSNDINRFLTIWQNGTVNINPYNPTTGSYSIMPVATGEYYLGHVAVINTKTVCLVGQNTYSTLDEARVGALTELDTILNRKFIPYNVKVASFIYHKSSSYTNPVGVKLVPYSDTEDYLDWTKNVIGVSSGESPSVDLEWGNITGNLADQTDLNTALSQKLSRSTTVTPITSGAGQRVFEGGFSRVFNLIVTEAITGIIINGLGSGEEVIIRIDNTEGLPVALAGMGQTYSFVRGSINDLQSGISYVRFITLTSGSEYNVFVEKVGVEYATKEELDTKLTVLPTEFTGNVLPLDGRLGRFQMGAANNALAFTFGETQVIGGWGRVWSNAISEPSLPVTAIKIHSAEYEPNGDNVLYYEKVSDTRVEYFFLPLNAG